MDSKMTTITAAEFVSEGYAAKIAAGECTVKSPLYTHPPQSLVDEQQTELTSLRAQVATLNAAIADYVDGCDGVGGSYEQARKSFDVLYEIRNRE